MPHLVLEYSFNVIEKDKLPMLFTECHTLLANVISAKVESCKSRAIEHKIYCVGNADPKNAFVHVSLKIMPGRSEETLKNAGESLLQLLKQHFAESAKQLNFQITLDISNLQTYFVA